MLFVVFLGVSSLSKCSPLVSSLLATIMSYWEVYRGSSVDQSTLNFKVTCFITDIMTKVCLIKSFSYACRALFAFSSVVNRDREPITFFFSSHYHEKKEMHFLPNDLWFAEVLLGTLWIELRNTSVIALLVDQAVLH